MVDSRVVEVNVSAGDRPDAAAVAFTGDFLTLRERRRPAADSE
jgi:hypothetical protein